MKKSLLTSLATLLAFGISAQTSFVASPNVFPVPQRGISKTAKAPARAEEGQDPSVWFTYADGIGAAVGVGQECYLSGVMQLPAATAQKYLGARIEKVQIGFGQPTNDGVSVFIAKNLGEDPVYMQAATVDAADLTWSTITLDQPYEIDGTDLYIGYIVKEDASDSYPVGLDGYATSNTYGDIVGIGTTPDPTAMEWSHIGSMYGSISLKVQLVGNVPAVNANLTGLYGPSRVGVDTPFDIWLALTNLGSDPISTIGLTYIFGDEIDTREITLDEPVASGESSEVPVSFTSTSVGTKDITIALTSVNGQEIDAQTGSLSVDFTICKTPRMMVVEEATSIGCGYCPIGIVGMEFMKTNFPDNFIGIAAHSTGQGNDPMIITSYNGLSSSLPGCLTNGRAQYTPDNYPMASNLLQTYYSYFAGNTGEADVYVEKAQWNAAERTGVNIKVKTMFGNNVQNADYRVAYVLVENNVGPYNQKNYLAGQAPVTTDYGDWGQKSSPVSTMFDDVARWISNRNGDPGSFPATIVAGEFYETECTVPLTGLSNYYGADIEVNPDNIEVIALIMDASRNILNAVRVKAADIELNESIHAQNIVWDVDTSANYAPGTTIELPETSDRGLALSYSIECEPADCASLEGYTLSFDAIGSVTVTANQEGDDDTLAALPVTKTFSSRYEQEITWDQEFVGIEKGVAFPLIATATSGLPVKFKLKAYTSKATIKSTTTPPTITFKQAATVTVVASQAGDASWAPAPDVEREIVFDPSGIETVDIDSLSADAAIFDLRGVRVERPAAGNIYIVVDGVKAQKVLVK